MICFIPHYRDQTAIAKVTSESFTWKFTNSRKNFCGKNNPSLCYKALFLAPTTSVNYNLL